MKIVERLWWILGLPAGYRLFGHIVRGQALKIYLEEYVKAAPGEKALDIGCGPAEILKHLPQVDYTGLDISREYIQSAQKRLGSKGRFRCSDIRSERLEQERASFDLVLATGVVHHLDDAGADRLFALARTALRPKGRLITFDGCYVPEQSKMARWMLRKDRGKFVRTPAEYFRLASVHFSRVESAVRHDLLRIPYTHLILRCSN